MGMFCLHNSNSWTGETYVYRIMRVGFEFNYDLKQSNHNKAQQSKNRVHISWHILYC